MRVVADLHHSVLWESLAILFVDRAILGPAELYVWVDGHYIVEEGVQVEEFGRRPIALSTETLRSLGADIVISTVGRTREPMRSLADSMGALYVDHIGNAWDQPIGSVVLWATRTDMGVSYHPEFHRTRYFPPEGDRIGAFHASLQGMPCWSAFQEAGGVLYGTVENQLRPHEVMAARMDCLAVWHCKDADGYGFGVHEAFASGRAVIGHASHYAGKYAEPLFVRGVTYLEPEDARDGLAEIGRSARAHFDSLVDFDEEAAQVGAYLWRHTL